MQRLIANLLMYWMLLLVPGATALDLVKPQVLLPACCRIHGAHRCTMDAVGQQSGVPSWRGEGCPFAKLSHAAILLAPYLPAQRAFMARTPQAAWTPAAGQASLAAWLAGLPGSRAPPLSFV